MTDRDILGNLTIAASQYNKEKNYWLKKLSGEIQKSSFPYDHSKTGVKWAGDTAGKAKITGAMESARTNVERLSQEVFTRLVKLSRNSDYVLHMIFAAGAAALLYKYTGSRDIILGTPIYKQEKDADFLNTVLPLRFQLEKQTNFKELLVQVRQAMVEANENQNYPLETLLYQLNMSISAEEFPLFDVAVLLENIHDKRYILHTHPRVIFSFLRTRDHIEAWVEYSALLYEKNTIHRIAGHFKRLIEAAVVQIDTPLSRLDILTEEEKKQLLVDFNDTRRDYPDSKSIHDLFAEQAARTPDHTALTYEGEPMTYRALNEKADALAAYLQSTGIRPEEPVALLAADTHDVITALLGILKAGGAYLPLNADYPPERQKYILNDCSAGILLTNYHDSPHFVSTVIDLEDENIYRETKVKKIDAPHPGNHLAYIIYTSGSTGEPKGVMVQHRSVVRLVKNTDYIKFEQGDSILLTGALEFDASTFEIWGALLNGLTLHLIRKENILTPHRFKNAIAARGVTTMWLTSPLFNQMLDMDIRVFAGLKKLLVGGDVLSPPHIDRLRARYPGLTVINGYGPTENTTFSTTYQIKSLHEENIPIGKPIANSTAYILDDFYQPVPVGVAGELFVGGAGLARGYLNNPGLTAEKFCLRRPGGRFLEKLPPWTPRKNFLLSPLLLPYSPYSPIYRTGDLARWQPDGNIEFLGRKDHQVKIRGFRIEPGEIENYLARQPGIKEAVVVDRKTMDGDKYLCAYVIPGEEKAGSLDTVELRKILSRQLPEYMVPAYFVVLREIPLTANGKVNRRALPEPEVHGDIHFTAPKNPIEQKFVEIWSEVLNIDKEKIGIDTNFFELGGHSLKAAVLTAKIHQALNIKIPLAEIFGTPTIRELAQYAQGMTGEKFVSIEPVEEKEYYELSSAQKRMYVLQEIQPGNTVYNIPAVYILEGNWEPAKIEETFRKLIARHESLRTSFERINEIPVQEIHRLEKVKFKIEYHIAKRKVQSAGPEEERHALDTIGCAGTVRNFVRSFDLSKAPLIRVELIKLLHTPSALRVHPRKENSDGRYLLMVDMHHIITDGTSMDLFVKEFMALYTGEELPPLRLQYKDFSGWQNSGKQKEAIKYQEEYWIRQFESEAPVLNLPLDYPRPSIQGFEGSTIRFELPDEQTRALNHLASENEVTLYMLLLTIFNILLAKLSGQEDIVVGSPIAARRHADLERIIGMFVNTLALRNHPNPDKTFIQFLKEIKEKTLAAFENQDYPFEELVEQVVINRDASRNPLFDPMLVFQDWAAEAPVTTNLEITPYEHENNTAKFDMTLGARLKKEQLIFTMGYSTKLFNRETILRFTRYFKQIISIILENPHKKIAEIEIISREEKKRVLVDFNDTAMEFPADKTIPGLFEEQVERTPDHIAAAGPPQVNDRTYMTDMTYISYRELNNRSNHLAHLLQNKNVKPDSIVGIMMERSIDMIIGLWGILKAGAAYLPIDPDYPGERIRYMLEDSRAKVLVTAGSLVEEDEKLKSKEVKRTYETIFIDTMEPANLSTSPSTRLPSFSLAYIIYTSGSTGKPKGVIVEHRSVVNRLNWMQREYPIGVTDVILQKTSITFDVSVWELFWWSFQGASLRLLNPGEEKNPAAIAKVIAESHVTIVHFVPSMMTAFLEYLGGAGSRYIETLAGLKQVFSSGEALTIQQVERFNTLLYQANKTKLANLYGPTEATVDVSYFNCPSSEKLTIVPIGKPIDNIYLYVVDRKMSLQPIGVTGELCISGAGVARGYLNRPGLTAEKFEHDLRDYQDYHGRYYRSYSSHKSYIIYRTGDLARWLPDGNIEYLGRMDHQVKIRGFRIELGEIEKQLLNHNQVKEAAVIAGEFQGDESTPGNQMDRYLCAYITAAKELTVPALREYLARTLPGYMIPSYFVIIEKLPLTPSGKLDRKSLPVPVPETGPGYIAPRDEVEEKLAAIWTGILGREALHASQLRTSLGIDDNFFQLGGHSLKATIMISKIHKTFDVQLPLGELFKNPSIRKLAKYIKSSSPHKFETINAVEKKEYFKLSSAQVRLYALQQIHPGSNAYNMPMFFALPGEDDIEKLKNIIKELVNYHESLRTSFHMVNNEMVQKVHDEVELEIEPYQVEVKVEDDDIEGTRGLAPLPGALSPRGPRPTADIISSFIRPFDLSRPPLLRVGLIQPRHTPAVLRGRPSPASPTTPRKENPGGLYLLMVDMHHIISDGMSQEILAKDFQALSRGKNLYPLRIQYKDYSEWQNRKEEKDKIKQQEAYWLNEFKGEIPLLNMPTDYQRPEVLSFSGDSVRLDIDQTLTRQIKELAARLEVTLMMFLLSVYKVLLSRYSGQEELVVGTVIAGRPHADLENIIGFFVNMLPIKTRPGKNQGFSDYVRELKEKALNAFENQEYPFEEMVSRLGIQRQPGRHSLVEVVFVFMEETYQAVENRDLGEGEKSINLDPRKVSHFDLMLHATDRKDSIGLVFEYSTVLYKESTVKKFANAYIKILEQVLENPGFIPGEINISLNLQPSTSHVLQTDNDEWDL